MPCMCWYEPDDDEKKEFKSLCQSLVDLIKRVNKKGDAMGSCTLKSAHELIDHLYNPSKCKDAQDAKNTNH